MYSLAASVRSATARDAQEVVRIYVDSSNAGFGARMAVKHADAARIAQWRATLAELPPARWWVAERERALVGVIGIGPSRDPIDSGLGEVDTLAVDPPAWRSGVASALMATALAALRADGYRLALLWTLRDYALGEAFYRSTGWRPNGALRRGGEEARWDHTL